MADLSVYLPAGVDLQRIKAVAERIVEGTRVWCSVDDTAVEYRDLGLGIEVAVDLSIVARDEADLSTLDQRAGKLKEALIEELGVAAWGERELERLDEQAQGRR